MQGKKPHCTIGDILNSHATSKKESKVTQPLIKVAYLPHPEESISLSPKQKDIISFLKDSIRDLQNCGELTSDNYERLREQHLECVSEAVRAGLIWHPLVSDVIYTHKALGNRELLKNIKRGLETGVKRPLTINDLKFRNRLEEIAKFRIEGKTWPQIRLILLKKRIIKKMTWQALQKKFEKAWDEEWKKVNKKAPLVP